MNLRIVDIEAEIWTGHLPNTSRKNYSFIQLDQLLNPLENTVVSIYTTCFNVNKLFI